MRLRAFTLLELLTVVAIIAVLAALGIPLFHDAQMKARFSEIRVMTPQFLDTTLSFYESQDYTAASVVFTPSGAAIQAVCGNQVFTGGTQPWTCSTVVDGEYASLLGVAPDGDVYGLYLFGASNSMPDASCYGYSAGDEGLLRALAYSDLDRDGSNSQYICCDQGQVGANYPDQQSGNCGRLDATVW